MFNLGYKQIVINEDAVVKSEGGYIKIEGFGVFKIGEGLPGKEVIEPYIVPTLGLTAFSDPTGYTAGDIYDIRVYIRGPRVLSEIWSYGESIQFQTSPDATSFDDAMDKAVNNGLNNIVEYSGGVFTFKEGYEGLEIRKVTAAEAVIDTNIIYEPVEDITGAIIPGIEGTGTPKQIETSVHTTQGPYAIQFGGNADVDFNAEYTGISWEMFEDHYVGELPHELLGYGDANTEAKYAPRKYTAYVSDSAAAALALIDSITP